MAGRLLREALAKRRPGEDALIGSSVGLGETLALEIADEIHRCVMVTRPQPGG